jgi:tripartite-type tricarboxylate transporter receptor subunit TctC
MRHFFRALFLWGALSVFMLPSLARATETDWPKQPILLISAYPPGGPTDIMSRLLAEPLAKKLGTPVIVENKPGAAGNIGTTYAARAKPDGYTISLVTAGSMSVNPVLFKNLSYDPEKDFRSIIQISRIPLVLEVSNKSDIKNVQDFIEYVKKNPEKAAYGSASHGTPQHLAGALFSKQLGSDMLHVPYQGAGPAINDLLGGHIFSMFDIMVSSLPHLQSGNLRPLAVTTKDRSFLLPEVPTLDESGLPGFDFYAWHGIVAPAGTPDAIIEKFNTAFNEIFQDPEFQKRWKALGTEVVGGTPEQFTELVRTERERLGNIIRESGVQLD